MNRKEWQAREGHPPADLLLLHLDNELTGRTAEGVAEHLIGCAACRRECEQLQLGFSRFSTFRDNARVPIPNPRTDAFKARLLESVDNSPSLIERLRGLARINRPRRLGFALGGLSLGLLVWVSFFLTTPRQSVYASQLLDDARGASQSLIAHSKVLNQKIRLRRGALVIERNIHRGRPAPLQADEPKIDPGLQEDLNLARVNMNDPLNAEDFALWRAAQKDPRDSVRETQESVTITTRVADSAIAAGSLTLSRSGWRPIARSVEVQGEAPIEISELSYDISNASASTPETAIGALAPTEKAPVASGVASEVSMAELETSELDLREALHSIGADVSASPAVWIGDGGVHYYAKGSPATDAAIRTAAARIPYVSEAAKEPASLEEPVTVMQGSGPYATTPPLASTLQANLGNPQAVDAFLDGLRARSARVVAEASSLDELARRYPVDTVKSMPAGLRTRINKLAASMLSQLQHDSADFVKSVSPILDEAASDSNISAPAEPGNDAAGCMAWQQSAALAAPQLRQMARDVTLLFVPEQSDRPLVLDGGNLIQETLRARGFVELHLMSTCQLFGTN